MFDMDLIDFDVEKNKKKIKRLQKIKWCLNSRWPLKIVFGIESTNMHFFQNAFFLDFSSVLWSFYGKTFFFKSKMTACIEMAFLSFLNHPIFKKPLQAMTNTKAKTFMDLQRIYTQ
jgi:hypothetical protein